MSRPYHTSCAIARRRPQHPLAPRARFRALVSPAITLTLAGIMRPALAIDVSPPALLQAFENSYSGLESRMADLFKAGYGGIYTPPPGRASSGVSVGYDVYDRFDLGKPGDPTLYGTETGLRTLVNAVHTAGMDFGVDLVLNHSAFSDASTPGFMDSGGYPGLNIRLDPAHPNSQGYNDIDGDYHGAFEGDDHRMRISGLVDIAQEKKYQMIRSPVDPTNPKNIRPGTTPYNGRIANLADPNNARFYPDRNLQPISVFDPKTGEADIKIYPFNTADPMAGDAIEEDALGYLMRNTQWLVQSVGVDFFRMDATKHMPKSVLESHDRSVYRASQRTLLNGDPRHVFSFGEFYEGKADALHNAGVVRKDIDPDDIGRVGGNRDTLDFPLYFALKENLNRNGTSNDWNHVVNASLDFQGDGLHNGSQGVKFVISHDDGGPEMDNVGYAYALMMPGNALVYSNPQEFGTYRDFPKAGRGDALGGLYGDAITTLVDLRNRYGRGNYRTRFLEKENLAIERSQSAIVLLSNRGDAGFDSRTIQTDFQPGQFLIELTGNAASSTADPSDDIPQVLTVNPDKTVNVRFLRNKAPGTDNYTGRGYLIYGLASPQGSMSISNVAQTLEGWDLNTTGMNAEQKARANATRRVSDVKVITADQFNVSLHTNKVNLLGLSQFRDPDADGDSALIKLDGGIDLNGMRLLNGQLVPGAAVDHVTPGSVAYGFEEFTTVRQPGTTSANNNGTFTQTIDATQLSEGYHYITTRAFRRRTDGGPAIFSDFRETIYIDRLPPVTAHDFNKPWNPAHPEDRDFYLRSVDQTANSVHTFINLPANLTDQQILSMVNNNNKSDQVDRDLFKRGFFDIPSGNSVITAVTFEITGRYNIQRLSGINLATGLGLGVGDIIGYGAFTATDVANASGCFEQILYSQNAQFHPAADVNGDGRVNNIDLYLLPGIYSAAGAGAAANEALAAIRRRGNINGQAGTNAHDITALYQRIGQPYSWYNDLNADGIVSSLDVETLVRVIFNTEFGDANLDGRVNALDFNALASNFGEAAQTWLEGDFNGDGTVNTSDFNRLAGNFGFHAPAAGLMASAVVPEPAGAVLGMLLVGAGLRRCRRGEANLVAGVRLNG